MKDITNSFETYYRPHCALLIYRADGSFNDAYVEYFNIDSKGCPVNAHPLTVNEAKKLKDALNVDDDKLIQLKSDGIIPSNLLSFDAHSSKLIWWTKSQYRDLMFTDNLGISSGRAHVPAIVWIADRTSLQLYSLASDRKPNNNTMLYFAPFFNISKNGLVCMGTVEINTAQTGSVKELMALWENYFFNSYFSHLMEHHNPVKGNCVLLWESLIGSDKLFPTEILLKTTKKLKDILL